MSTRTPFQWDNANFAYNTNPFPNQSKNPFTWDDCALIEGIISAIQGGGYDEHDFWQHRPKEEKKRFIKLLCKVEGKEYKETKEVLNRKIRISDISLVAKEVLGINIKVDL
jgi:hypothetical protein